MAKNIYDLMQQRGTVSAQIIPQDLISIIKDRIKELEEIVPIAWNADERDGAVKELKRLLGE